jgi:ribosomal protein S26
MKTQVVTVTCDICKHIIPQMSINEVKKQHKRLTTNISGVDLTNSKKTDAIRTTWNKNDFCPSCQVKINKLLNNEY